MMTIARYLKTLAIGLTLHANFAFTADFGPPTLDSSLGKNLANSLISLEQRISQCEGSLQPLEPFTIAPDSLSKRKISFKELLTAFTYHAQLPHEVCPLAEKQQAIWAALKLHIARNNDNTELLNTTESGLALFLPSPAVLQNEFDYFSIPAPEREYFDNLFKGKLLTPRSIVNLEELRNHLDSIH